MRRIIDVHVHIGNDREKFYSSDDALYLMDKHEIKYAVISPFPTFYVPYGVKSSAEQNDIIANAIGSHPDRFIAALGTVDPRHGESALNELKRCMEDLNFRGLMFSNDKTGLTFDNPMMIKFMETLCNYNNPIVMCYTSQYSVLEAPYMLRKVAEQFSEITFINASSMKDTTHSNCSRYLSASVSNVYMDIANIHQLMHPIEWAIRDSGINKIFFGSNIPLYSECCVEKEMIENADITEQQREMIYSENAINALKLKI